uniref:Deaminase n=1 Tax=Thermosporothrix sp. COM3 TaxID=2490863 RepID=A0A455SFZ1_9CHLR|nr:deaminase [Thermosporothrix sp. COM3]
MGKVSTGFSMSLDGFVAGPNDSVEHVFAWMSQGNVVYTARTGKRELEMQISKQSIELLEAAKNSIGVLIAGRRLFEMTGGWGGRHPLNVPMLVVSHRPAPEWVGEDWPMTFVSDGLESAIAQGQAIAGEKKVVVASTTLVQQCLNAGLLDEIHIDLVPVLLGSGVRLFDHLKVAPIELGSPSIVEGIGVTHLTYQVKK